MPNALRPRPLRTSWRGVALGLVLGVSLGATAGWSVAAALQSGDEGAGYGGNANALQVEVVGEEVRVAGVGFLASSPVDVRVGDLRTTVTADEFGRVDTTLVAGDGAVSAVGLAGDGSERTLQPQPAADGGHTAATLFGAGLGAAPVLASRRKYVRVR